MLFNGYQLESKSEPAGLIYKLWKDQLKGGYFILSNEINDYFPFLKKSDAIMLYLFYAIKADNDYGTSTYGIETLSSSMNTTKKTINNWNNILIDAGLISRYSSSKYRSSVTELLPLKDTIIRPNKNDIERTIYHLEKLNGYTINSVVYLTWNLKSKTQSHKYIIATKECFKHQINKPKNKKTNINAVPPLTRYIVIDDTSYQPNAETTIKNTKGLTWLKAYTGEAVWKKTDNGYPQDLKFPSISLLVKTNKADELTDEKILQTLKQFSTSRKIRKFEQANSDSQVN